MAGAIVLVRVRSGNATRMGTAKTRLTKPNLVYHAELLHQQSSGENSFYGNSANSATKNQRRSSPTVGYHRDRIGFCGVGDLRRCSPLFVSLAYDVLIGDSRDTTGSEIRRFCHQVGTCVWLGYLGGTFYNKNRLVMSRLGFRAVRGNV